MASSFTLFGVTIYPYSLCMIGGVGLLFGLFTLFTARRRKDCLDENLFAIEMLVIAVAAALPAAMLFDPVFHWIGTGSFVFGGATFYGGLIGACSLYPLLLLLRKGRKVSVYTRLCDLAPCIAAGHCLGRIGCFLGGCCFGAPTDGPFGVVFPEGSLPYEYYGGAVAIHPTQLYEAAYLLVLFFVLWKMKHAFPAYLILYGTGRFLIEFLRNDDRGGLAAFPLSPAQCISLLLVAVGAAMFLALFLRRKKTQ